MFDERYKSFVGVNELTNDTKEHPFHVHSTSVSMLLCSGGSSKESSIESCDNRTFIPTISSVIGVSHADR